MKRKREEGGSFAAARRGMRCDQCEKEEEEEERKAEA